MSSAHDHHAQADQLLEEAHTKHDHISRSLLLAEAQVHATLALAAATGAGSGSRAAAQPSPLSGKPGTRAPGPITDIGGR